MTGLQEPVIFLKQKILKPKAYFFPESIHH